jgi:hypothetical protein
VYSEEFGLDGRSNSMGRGGPKYPQVHLHRRGGAAAAPKAASS